MRSKILLVILGIVLLLGLVFAVTEHLSSFEDQTNPFNVTLEKNVNNTQYIRVPTYGYAQNITITIRGVELS